MNRLSQLPTLRIDPAQKRSLNYKGKTYTGLAGDTVATALFANGVRVFARSAASGLPALSDGSPTGGIRRRHI